MNRYYDQSVFAVRLEWGRAGAQRAAARGDLLVVVDVLSFSTLVVTASARGAIIYPCTDQVEAEERAREVGGVVAVHRRDVPEKGRYSLSPVTFLDAPAGLRIAVASPNGATCSRYAARVPWLMVGGLLNAGAVAAKAATLANGGGLTILACGERWEEPGEDGVLRFALEDFLGAGAIIASLPPDLERSPEARSAEAAFRGLETDLSAVLLGCGSGIELVERGYPEDVTHAARLNRYSIVPILREGAFVVEDSPLSLG